MATQPTQKPLGFYLIVRNPFGPYKKGDNIRDANEIAKVLKDGHERDVHKVIG